MNLFFSQMIWIVLGIVIGLVAGYFLATYLLEKRIKNNPPVTEKMIRAMYMQMGRKASEAQIKAVMKTFKQN